MIQKNEDYFFQWLCIQTVCNNLISICLLKYNNFCQQTMRINPKIIVKKNFEQNKRGEISKGSDNKQQSININNIRESGYKIIRSKSNRSEHSLSTKKPFLFNHSSNKRLQNKQPTTPHSFTSHKLYLTTENKASNKSHTVTNFKQKIKTLDCDPQKDIHNETFTYEKESLFNSNHRDSKNSEEITCIKNIWDNLKILKQRHFYPSQIAQLEKIIESVLVQIAEDQSYLTQRKSQPVQSNLWKTFTTKKKQAQLQKMLDLFKTKKMQKINTSQEYQKDSYKSSFQSFKIQNEQSHKYEFLNMYQQSQLNGIYLGLSNQPQHNMISNSISNNESMKANNSSNNSSDRVYLKNIIKKNKKASGFSGKGIEKPLIEGFCSKPQDKQNKIEIATYSCGIFDCDSSKKQSSAGSSESKRQVLNQIISMLNYKYQKNIKIEFNKVII